MLLKQRRRGEKKSKTVYFAICDGIFLSFPGTKNLPRTRATCSKAADAEPGPLRGDRLGDLSIVDVLAAVGIGQRLIH